MASSELVVKAGYWYWESEFQVTKIDSTLFTHLFAAFANVDPRTFAVTFPHQYSHQFKTFTKTVQAKNPEVKTLLSIAIIDPEVVSTGESRRAFIRSSIEVARRWNFHGLDLSWRYPSTTSQMANFGSLINEWRIAVIEEATESRKPLLLLTAMVYYRPYYSGFNYPFEAITNSLDWINVLIYDFYNATTSPDQTAPPAAFYNPSNTSICGDTGISEWIEADRVPAKKLVPGLPFFGCAWRLVNNDMDDVFNPAGGPADGRDHGMDISPNGSINYYHIIVDFITQRNAQHEFDHAYCTDYCYTAATWIGYDDTVSIHIKVNKFKEKELLGYFAWHVGGDYNWTLSREAFNI